MDKKYEEMKRYRLNITDMALRTVVCLTITTFALLFGSCGRGNLLDIKEGACVLPKIIDRDVVLRKGVTYLLEQRTYVTDCCVLTIERGVVIKVPTYVKDPCAGLVICTGSSIIACGTEKEPIVMTAASERPGSWDGITLLGQATGNKGKMAVDNNPEEEAFGGTVDDDYSGRLSYVCVEYAGSKEGAFNFYNTGRQTKVDHCQAYCSGRYGFAFTGGRVNAYYLVSTAALNTGLYFDHGYEGYLQFVRTIAPKNQTSKQYSVEVQCGNGSGGFYTRPVIANLTTDTLANGKIAYNSAVWERGVLLMINSNYRPGIYPEVKIEQQESRLYYWSSSEYPLASGRKRRADYLGAFALSERSLEDRQMLIDSFLPDERYFIVTKFLGAVCQDAPDWAKEEWVKQEKKP